MHVLGIGQEPWYPPQDTRELHFLVHQLFSPDLQATDYNLNTLQAIFANFVENTFYAAFLDLDRTLKPMYGRLR